MAQRVINVGSNCTPVYNQIRCTSTKPNSATSNLTKSSTNSYSRNGYRGSNVSGAYTNRERKMTCSINYRYHPTSLMHTSDVNKSSTDAGDKAFRGILGLVTNKASILLKSIKYLKDE